ncbi:MAG: putative zinc-binding metallopeptidase [Desulfohalobiaceae bacterium]
MSYLQNQPSSVGTRGTYLHSWDSSQSVIVIYPFRSRAEFFHALYHEIGHHVFLRVLLQQQRDKWFFKVRPHEQGFVTQRAAKNAREDFAETYACYCASPQLLFRAPKKRDFVQLEAFAGRALEPASPKT